MSNFTRTVPATLWRRAVEAADRIGENRPNIDSPPRSLPRALRTLITRINGLDTLPEDLKRWYALFQCVRRMPEDLSYRGGSISLLVTPRRETDSITGAAGVARVVLRVDWPANPHRPPGAGLHMLSLPQDIELTPELVANWPMLSNPRAFSFPPADDRHIPATRAVFTFSMSEEAFAEMPRASWALRPDRGALTIRPAIGDNEGNLAVLLDLPEAAGLETFIVQTAHMIDFVISAERHTPDRTRRFAVFASNPDMRFAGQGIEAFCRSFPLERYRSNYGSTNRPRGVVENVLNQMLEHGVIIAANTCLWRMLNAITSVGGVTTIEALGRQLQSIAPGMAVLSQCEDHDTVVVRLVDLTMQRELGRARQLRREAAAETQGSITMTMGNMDSNNLAAMLFGDPHPVQAQLVTQQEATVASKPTPIVTQSNRRIRNPQRGNKDVAHDNDQRGGNQIHPRTLRRSRRAGK